MKKYFRVTMKGPWPAPYYDIEVPQEASLTQFWGNVLATGFVATERFIVAVDQISLIQVVTMDVAQQGWRPQVVN